jgi:hypothetical protein
MLHQCTTCSFFKKKRFCCCCSYMPFLNPFHNYLISKFFHRYCNQYEPRPVNDILYFRNSIETIVLKNITVCHPIFPFPMFHGNHNLYDPRPVDNILYFRNAIETTIVRSLTLYPHQLCCLRFDIWSITPILAL